MCLINGHQLHLSVADERGKCTHAKKKKVIVVIYSNFVWYLTINMKGEAHTPH